MKKPPGDTITLHMCTINDNHMMYGPWDMEHDRQFFVALDLFLPFYALKTPKNQNFEKMKKKKKKKTGEIIILNMCIINDNCMMYGFWDIERDRPKFLLLWTIFCPFTPLKTKKIKTLKKWKKPPEILSFYTSVP